ncbi:MAG: hypothetical protein ACTSUC_01745 [Promethearchaeota archaeon]
MLKETERSEIVDRINSLDFTYQGKNPQVKVYRYGEGFSRTNPTILVQFMPANRKKFQSVGDVIGKASGDYYQYGYCQIELCSIHCYCQEKHETADKLTLINGRMLCYHMAEKCLYDILKVWENILFDFNASLDRKEAIIIKDLSTYDPVTETRIYNYDIDVYLRTQFRWDKVSDEYDEEGDLAEIIELAEIEETKEETKDNIIIKIDI